MQHVSWWLIAAAAGLLVGSALACFLRPSEDLLSRVRSGLPDSIGPWTATGEDSVYDLEGLYGYIDGHAEVYRAYGVERCLARRYEARDGGDELILDLFVMPTAADAFGVFTHDLGGDEAGLGRGSRLRPGWLSLWQGRVFVSVFTADDSPEATKSLLNLGALVAGLVPEGGDLPPILDRLPAAGLDRGDVRYLYDPMILGTHLFVGFDNPLGLGPATPAALARYDRGGVGARLLVVEYPDAQAAAAALAAARANLLDGSGADRRAPAAPDEWRGARASGRVLAVVVEGGTEEIGAALLGEALAGRNGDRRTP